MFKSSERPNPLDSVVVKATSEELTAENWEYILDVCDQVNEHPEDGSNDAVRAVIKRLETKNANVQLYSLTLVGSMAQNCGSKMQRELASKNFTGLLLKLAQDKHVHQTVKSKIVELMESLSKEFKSDPSLRQMEDAYNTLRQNTNIQPPAKPDKQQLTEADRQREEDELQMVLALSLSEAEASKAPPRQQQQQPPQSQTQPQQPRHEDQFQPSYEEQQMQNQNQNQSQSQSQSQSVEKKDASGQTAATVKRVRALYDLNSTEEGELSFRKGDVIHVIEAVYRDWWRGTLRGQVGIFPLNYVIPIPEPTQEELQREAQEEVNVFSQSRNIEKLLAVLSSADSQNDGLRIAENEQLQNLYHTTLAVRPKLVKLIDKYSQKKDDLIELNDKFINARKMYDNLMENSLAQYRVASPQQAHPQPQAMPQPPPMQSNNPYRQPQQQQQQHQQPSYPAPPSTYPPSSAPPPSQSPQQQYTAPPPSQSPQQQYSAPPSHPQYAPAPPAPSQSPHQQYQQQPQPLQQQQQQPQQPQQYHHQPPPSQSPSVPSAPSAPSAPPPALTHQHTPPAPAHAPPAPPPSSAAFPMPPRTDSMNSEASIPPPPRFNDHAYPQQSGY